MAIVLINSLKSSREWEDEFRKQATANYPDLDLRVWPDIGNAEDITQAVVAFPEQGAFAKLPNLKFIHSLWAGIERLVTDPDRPYGVPIFRMVDFGLTQGMVDYMTGHTYRHHLGTDRVIRDNANAEWNAVVPPLATDRTVGILGLGVLGMAVANNLHQCGFKVIGWSRSAKSSPDFFCLAGDIGLNATLEQSSILLLLLPRTPLTENIINAETLAKLPRGAAIINAGRGELIDDDALLAALDSGQISGATLDVFREEPLPPDHPYWSHPQVLVTPHIAAETRIVSGTRTVLENVHALDHGGDQFTIPGRVSPDSSY